MDDKNLNSEVRVKVIEETDKRFNNPVIIVGFPEVGLVGTIATSFMLDKLNFEEIGYIDSELFPPLVVIHNGDIKNPVRIYSDKDGGIIAILSEIAISPSIISPLAESLVDWFKGKNASSVILLSGISVTNRLEIEEPECIGISNTKETKVMLKNADIEEMLEGFLIGIYPELLKRCKKEGVPGILLLSQCFPNYPDPEAAASVLKSLQKLINIKIDLEELFVKGEEIKVKARDLMKQTRRVIGDIQKNIEQSLPIMYG